MGAAKQVTVSLTKIEIAAIVLALSELIYILEEGDVAEAFGESDLNDYLPAINNSDVADLQNRLDSLLQ